MARHLCSMSRDRFASREAFCDILAEGSYATALVPSSLSVILLRRAI